MYKEALRPAWAEINLSNLAYNVKQIRNKVGNREIIGVVKADAYGHGSVKVSKTLLENGIKTLAIATLDEAVTLRKAGFTCPIIMLGLTPDMYCDVLFEYDITPVTNSLRNARIISQLAEKQGLVKDVYIAVDTGMGRIGFLPDAKSADEAAEIAALSNIHFKGLFSHFATADEQDKTYALEQTEKFNSFLSMLKERNATPAQLTMANSAAIMEVPSAHFDAVRPGIILYGCYPSNEVDRNKFSIKPVMSVKANIVHIKEVPPETSISYGRRFTTSQHSLIATLTLGYADGYPRFLSGKGRVIVNNTYAPLVGNICMDQCMVDVSMVPGVKLGDEVIIMGSSETVGYSSDSSSVSSSEKGPKIILADEIGEKTGTINYEVVCGFGQRLPKIYV